MFQYVAIACGVAGVIFGVRCYMELRKWARMCQRATIAIAQNRKVQMNAPLVDWVTWCHQLTKEEAARGRTVYRNGKVSVSILLPKANVSARTTVKRVRRSRKRKAVEA